MIVKRYRPGHANVYTITVTGVVPFLTATVVAFIIVLVFSTMFVGFEVRETAIAKLARSARHKTT